MPRPALVPIADLAVVYVEAVEAGRKPYRVLMSEFGLTLEQVDKRAWRLRKSGWLPPGSTREEGWLATAKEILAERLDYLAAREQTQQELLETRLRRARAALERERKPLVPRQYSLRKKEPVPAHGSVLDLFW
jgi:hypothetical protein